MKKSDKILVSCTILIMIVTLIVAFTFAFLGYDTKQEDPNIYKTSCYKISYSENVEGVTIENAYPISDEEGLSQDPYEVTITNNCQTAMTYNVLLNVQNSSTTDESLIRIGINDTAYDLIEFSKVDAMTTDSKYAYNIKTDTVAVGESKTLKFRSWLGPQVTIGNGENSRFVNKISVDITNIIN